MVIDKLEYSARYKTWRYDPYHYCMAILLERYVLYLSKNKLRGDVLAEGRGGKESTRLKRSFRRICDLGTQHLIPDKITDTLTSKEIKIKLKSNNITGLQLADLSAHPGRREILLENKKINDNRTHIFSEKINEILKKNMIIIKGEYMVMEKIFFHKKKAP